MAKNPAVSRSTLYQKVSDEGETGWQEHVEECLESSWDLEQDQYEEAVPEETDWDVAVENNGEACWNSDVENDIEVNMEAADHDQQEEPVTDTGSDCNEDGVVVCQMQGWDSDQEQVIQEEVTSDWSSSDQWHTTDNSGGDWNEDNNTNAAELQTASLYWNEVALANEKDTSSNREVEILGEEIPLENVECVNLLQKAEDASDSDDDKRPFACDECSKRYMQKSSLAKHKLYIHRKRKGHFRFPPKNVA
uniref:C2H2-type domain-containing protein n=1 Tax=Anopheles dirus TaxID=7168 RepID=A0A182NY58_9DIPT